ncbi:hypothetical protein D3C87_1998390 [compost metagenome]
MGVAEVRVSDLSLLSEVKAWSRKLSRRLTVSILAEKDSSLVSRLRVASDTVRSKPISARVCAFSPDPSWVWSLPSWLCMVEMAL